MDINKYNSMGVSNLQPLGSQSPASNPGVVYQPANTPTNPGALKVAQSTVQTLTFIVPNGNRVRITTDQGTSPFQEQGTVAVLNRAGLIIAQLGSDPTASVPDSELQAYRPPTNTSVTPLLHVQDDGTTSTVTAEFITKAVVSTHFAPLMQFDKVSGTSATVNFFVSDGTTPNGNLSDLQGSICYNGPSGQPFYCTGGTSWTGF